MRGRPKLDDSRINQYRVRLNDEENRQLAYVSERLERPKSEVFRLALSAYYNKVRLNELNLTAYERAAWDMGTITLKRVVTCPHCKEQNRIDLEDGCSESRSERSMGAETLYEFDVETTCDICGLPYRVSGYISEYPPGALNFEEIKITPIETEDETNG